MDALQIPQDINKGIYYYSLDADLNDAIMNSLCRRKIC